MRRARFQVAGTSFNGARRATVIIEGQGSVWLIRVRPYRRRKSYDWPLELVARDVIYTRVRADLEAKRREAAHRRRGRP
jgi:hypothetical protein